MLLPTLGCSIDDGDLTSSKDFQKKHHQKLNIDNSDHFRFQNLKDRTDINLLSSSDSSSFFLTHSPLTSVSNTSILANTVNNTDNDDNKVILFDHTSSSYNHYNLKTFSEASSYPIDSIAVIDKDFSYQEFLTKNHHQQLTKSHQNIDDNNLQLHYCFDQSLSLNDRQKSPDNSISHLHYCDLIVNSKDLPSSYIFIPNAQLTTDLSDCQDSFIDQYQHIQDLFDNPSQSFNNTHNFSTATIFPPILASLGLASSIKLTNNALLSGIIIIASVGIISGYFHSITNNLKDFLSLESSASNNQKRNNPMVTKRSLSSSQPPTNNNPNPNPNKDPTTLPVVPDLDQQPTLLKKPTYNPLMKERHAIASSSKTKDQNLDPTKYLPNHRDDNFFHSLEKYHSRLSNIKNFHFLTIEPQELNPTEQQKQFLTPLIHLFYSNKFRHHIDNVIYKIYRDRLRSDPSLKSYYNDFYMTRSVRKKVLITWIYLNYGVLDTAIALILLTDQPINIPQLADLFNLSEHQIDNSIDKMKSELVKIYHRDYLHTIKNIEVFADLFTMSFSLIPQYHLIEMINYNFQLNYFLYDFYQFALSFIKLYRLSPLHRILFIKQVLKFNSLGQDIEKIVLNFTQENNKDIETINSEVAMMEDVFHQFLFTKRYQIKSDRSTEIIDKTIDSISNFESGIYSQIHADYHYRDQNTITYRKNNTLNSRLDLTIQAYYDQPNSFDLSKSDLRKILFVEIFSKSKNHIYFSKLVNLDDHQYLTLTKALHDHYTNLGFSYNHFLLSSLEDFLDFSDDKTTAAINHLFEFSDKNLLTDPKLIKKLISQFHNKELFSELERSIFLNFVLRLRLTYVNNLMFTSRKYYVTNPEINIFNNFNIQTYHQQPKTKIVQMIDQISHRFIEFVGESTDIKQ